MLKNWAKWTLVTLWIVLLLSTTAYWNPFTSLPALLKYGVVSVVAAAIFGAMYVIFWFYVMMAIIFPLPPRADAKAPKGMFKSLFPWMFKAPTINPKAPQTLSELIGNEQAKVEIMEVIDMIADPQKYQASGAELPKGMLFVGPPGVGKTLFARAIANEVGLPFYVVEGGSISGLIMGLGSLKMKTLFKKLRSHGRAILFIDEIDSIAMRRQQDRGMGGVADMNMTLNTILTEMDGFKSSDVILIGATNNDGILDPALMRAGRMDRRIYFQPPDPEDRKKLFNYYLSKVKADSEIDYEEIAKLTSNYSPAEIATVVNEAALICQRPGEPGRVTTQMLEKALTRVSVGLERGVMNSSFSMGTVDGKVRLDDVIGIDEVKQDILEVIDFLKHGDELRKIGAKVPKGLLLIGPPGVGKTMLAKAMANEANVPFFGLSASSLLNVDHLGQTIGAISALYSQARKSPAAIVFIDEIDAISFNANGAPSDTGNSRNIALNQLLVELDGFSASNVITIGATNNEGQLDPAFMRSGRFDRKAYVGLPDAAARKQIIMKYMKNVKVGKEPDIDKMAKLTTNFSGADIAAMVNEAAIIAVRKKRTTVESEDFEEAVDRISITAGHKLNTHGMNLSRLPDLETSLEDVKGMEEAKGEAYEVVQLLTNLDKIQQLGLKTPKGVLLEGPPGTGKTMLAKAIANTAGVPFFALSGADFQSMWAGVGANRVRAVYEQARRSGKPAIVFIDEIDAIGSARGVDRGGGAIQDSNKTLNSLLVEMDGFGKHKVLTIGATNNMRMLDRALLRKGRFDRVIKVPPPDVDGREAILQHYAKDLKVEQNVNLREIARMTVWRTGADLASIMNEAGLFAIRNGRTEINHSDLVQAVQRNAFGMSYSRNLLIDDIKAVAWHEAGHALVAFLRSKLERIQVVTIVPSTYAAGYMWAVDKEDRFTKTKEDYMVDIEISLGSFVSETMHLGTTTAGVRSDLRSAGSTARSMVRLWGMGGRVFNTFDAMDNNDDEDCSYRYEGPSNESKRELELATQKILEQSLHNVEELLTTHKEQLERLANALVEKETLYFEDVVRILQPDRSEADIRRELQELAERKVVGKRPILNIDWVIAHGNGTTNGGTAGTSGGVLGGEVTTNNFAISTDEE
jgi:cell division protease FtsH